MKNDWQVFWDSYRSDPARSEDDLFVQVGKTVNRKPISRTMFDRMVAEIIRQLELRHGDCLLDLCCGNGLLSYELAPRVKRVTAVDFAAHMIEGARRFKARPNISYHVGDVLAPLESLVEQDARPTKILMNDSLAYFEPSDLDRLLGNIAAYMKGMPFAFLLTGIPNVALKWNFYDTPERRARHLENEKSPHNTNDGMGRWWRASEIESACQALGLRLEVADQPHEISNYRMTALISQA